MVRLNAVTRLALVLLLMGVGLIVLVMVAQLYADLLVVSPWLANGVLVLVIGTLAGAIALAWSTFRQLRSVSRRKQARHRPVIPTDKIGAAQTTLQAVEQQLQQIQDEVTRQVLQERSQRLAEEWQGRSLRVVVFGTGATGKTSLVNAIVGRSAGTVAAPIGTTTETQSYPLRLRGLDRRITLIDTPGLSEMGALGSDREAAVRTLATEADLLLFVVDNDLRQSEYEVVRSLLAMGKRLILILNKIDLYPEADVVAILHQLQRRFQDSIATDDLVAIAAHPAPVQLESGEWLAPEPTLRPLLQRMAEVLRSSSEELIADTILLQSQRLNDDIRQQLSQERRRLAEQVIERFQWIGAGVIAVTPLPGVDLIATAAVNAKMVVDIGKIYGCELDLESGQVLARSLGKTLIGLGVLKGAIELFSLALQTNVATFIIGRAVQGVTAAYLTRIAGLSFITYFQQDQDWGDGGISEVVEQQFQLNQRDEFIKAFVQSAIAQVIPLLTEPVTDQSPPTPFRGSG